MHVLTNERTNERTNGRTDRLRPKVIRNIHAAADAAAQKEITRTFQTI